MVQDELCFLGVPPQTLTVKSETSLTFDNSLNVFKEERHALLRVFEVAAKVTILYDVFAGEMA